jgi:hypothetical protein
MLATKHHITMKTTQAIVIFACLTFSSFALGQSPAPTSPTGTSSDQESNPAFWQANFSNGGHYLVKLNHINCASKHEYISDGAARVVEVTIGTDTAVVARFYYFEPVGKDTPIAAGQVIINRVTDVSQQIGSRVSPTAAKLNVVKNYPVSTHAHTVEYAVQDEATLSSLYGSLMAAINSGRGRTWKESTGK